MEFATIASLTTPVNVWLASLEITVKQVCKTEISLSIYNYLFYKNKTIGQNTYHYVTAETKL